MTEQHSEEMQGESGGVKVTALTDAGIPKFFEVAPGSPTDACPNCHIHREYAGNPLACGTHYGEPGCFKTEAE